MSVMKDVLPAIFTGGLSLPFTMLSGDQKEPKTPTVVQPNVMPQADSESVNNARKKAAVALQQQKGRMSTMLSNDDALGG
jgi:hypothetical protein